jgi:hypothetical protein
MKMYQLIKKYDNTEYIKRLSDGASISIEPTNPDYANFKKEVLAGAELQDADGNLMTPEQAKAYVATLP